MTNTTSASYATTVRLPIPFEDADRLVRAALADQGFGVLTEIDVRATLETKLGVDMEDYVILGACNPPLAHRALDSDRSLGLLLPCNVVVRSTGEGESTVEILDPMVMSQLSAAPGLLEVATSAATKLSAVVDRLVAAGGTR